MHGVLDSNCRLLRRVQCQVLLTTHSPTRQNWSSSNLIWSMPTTKVLNLLARSAPTRGTKTHLHTIIRATMWKWHDEQPCSFPPCRRILFVNYCIILSDSTHLVGDIRLLTNHMVSLLVVWIVVNLNYGIPMPFLKTKGKCKDDGSWNFVSVYS